MTKQYYSKDRAVIHKGYATAGAYQSRLHSPSDLWHSSISLVTKEELSVCKRKQRDNKALKTDL